MKRVELRAGILARSMRQSTRSAYFENLYEESGDPWKLDTTDPNRALWRYEWVLSRLSKKRYALVFELGCGNGNFTELLAPRCDQLVASDIAQTAVEEARRRVNPGNVRFERNDIIEEQFPVGRYNLILALEVLYYIPWHKTYNVCTKLVNGLQPGGELVIAELEGGSISAMHQRILPHLIPLVHEERMFRAHGRQVVQRTFRKQD